MCDEKRKLVREYEAAIDKYFAEIELNRAVLDTPDRHRFYRGNW
jgi:hypothetical protein